MSKSLLVSAAALVAVVAGLSVGGCPADQMTSDVANGTTGNASSNNNNNNDDGAPPTAPSGTGLINNNGDGSSSGDDSNAGAGDAGANSGDGDVASDGGNVGGDTGGGNAGGGTDAGGGSTGGGDTAVPGIADAVSSSFSGTVNRQVSQTAGGSGGTPKPESAALDLAFDENGLLTGLLVPGFSSAPDQFAAVQNVGDQVILEQTINGTYYKLTVTVESAEYSGATARVVLKLRHRSESGQLVEKGPGTQTVDVSLSGDVLTYNSTTQYDVTFTAGSIELETSETIVGEATLNRQ